MTGIVAARDVTANIGCKGITDNEDCQDCSSLLKESTCSMMHMSCVQSSSSPILQLLCAAKPDM